MVLSKRPIAKSDTFTELYQTKDDRQKRKIKEVIEQLAEEDNPYRLGEKMRNSNFRTTRLSLGDRLAYDVSEGILRLHKVCSHREVYGRG